MKKVLFATTALVASAGIASAQGVTLSGSAEMGIVGGDAYGGETQFHTDLDVKFSLSGETDNGLTFGATIDLDEVGDDCTGATFTESPGVDNNGDGIFGGSFTYCRGGDPISNLGRGSGTEEQSVFLSGNFGTITMGDTDGAFDWALTELDSVGSIDDANTTHAGFTGNSGLDGTYDGQIARYDYSFGDFAFAVSAELDDSGVGDPVFGIGGKYKADMGGTTIAVGLGYQTVSGPLAFDGAEIVGISGSAKLSSGIYLAANYSTMSFEGGGPDTTHTGVEFGYSMDAISVALNYGEFDFGGGFKSSGIGLAANYDLGGGAVVQFGYGNSSFTVPGPDPKDVDQFSLGVAMSF